MLNVRSFLIKALFFALAIIFTIICLSNTQRVNFHLLLDYKFIEVPLFVIIFISIACGCILNLIFLALIKK